MVDVKYSETTREGMLEWQSKQQYHFRFCYKIELENSKKERKKDKEKG